MTTFEKVTDFTHTKGRREEIDTTLDIGIAGECLAECTSKVRYCVIEYAKHAIFFVTSFPTKTVWRSCSVMSVEVSDGAVL